MRLEENHEGDTLALVGPGGELSLSPLTGIWRTTGGIR